MTFTVIILLLTLLAGLWLAADLLRPGIRAMLPGAAPEGAESTSASYAPVSRLLAEADFAYLADEADLASRLRESRNAAMRLYLKRIRRDYLEVWRACRILAPISPDPTFASNLTTQYWTFHWAYFGIAAQCMLPGLVGSGSAAEHLVETLSELRTQARGLLAVAEPSMAASASAA